MLSLLSAAVFRFLGERPFAGWVALTGSTLVIVACVGCFWLCERPFLPRRRQRVLISPATATMAASG